VKLRYSILIIALIIIADQAIKIWIKTSYPLGEVHRVFGLNQFRLHFIENPGMAWGMQLGDGNEWGKAALTIFRLVAVIVGSWYLVRVIRRGYSRGFIICASLIYAGALGNLIDSMFYGLIFDRGMLYDPASGMYLNYQGVAEFSSDGYQSFLHGNVVDMLYFPIVDTTWPDWVPLLGGKSLEFFSPIFNIADAAISVGVITLLIFQKRFFRRYHPDDPAATVETETATKTETA
jgi:signal peptidase II